MALPRFCSHCAAPLPSPPPVTCRSCDTSHWLDAKPCAGALVARGDQLMLVRRAHDPWRGAWDVPGGFCGPREHPKDAAEREVREETGLAVRVGSVLGMWIDTYAREGADADKVTLNIYFHATVRTGAQARMDPNEVAEIGWFAADELPVRPGLPGPRPRRPAGVAREPRARAAAGRPCGAPHELPQARAERLKAQGVIVKGASLVSAARHAGLGAPFVRRFGLDGAPLTQALTRHEEPGVDGTCQV